MKLSRDNQFKGQKYILGHNGSNEIYNMNTFHLFIFISSETWRWKQGLSQDQSCQSFGQAVY